MFRLKTFNLREMLEMLWGSEGKRKIRLRRKTKNRGRKEVPGFYLKFLYRCSPAANNLAIFSCLVPYSGTAETRLL
jgi:hypothetical protein